MILFSGCLKNNNPMAYKDNPLSFKNNISRLFSYIVKPEPIRKKES